MMKIYLGGGIRRGPNSEVFSEDAEWRNYLEKVFKRYGISSFDPLVENEEIVEKWSKSNFDWDEKTLTSVYLNDIRGMNESDVGIFNLKSLKDGYPNQGSLFEIGYMTCQGKRVIIATDDKRIRHNPMFVTCEFVNEPEEFIQKILDSE